MGETSIAAAPPRTSARAGAEESLAATGFGPGGVCPFGLDPGIRIFVDAGLSAHPVIYPAAGTDSSGVPMTFEQLIAVTGGTVGDFLVDGGEGQEG